MYFTIPVNTTYPVEDITENFTRNWQFMSSRLYHCKMEKKICQCWHPKKSKIIQKCSSKKQNKGINVPHRGQVVVQLCAFLKFSFGIQDSKHTWLIQNTYNCQRYHVNVKFIITCMSASEHSVSKISCECLNALSHVCLSCNIL